MLAGGGGAKTFGASSHSILRPCVVEDICGGFSRNVWRRRVIGWQVRLKSKSMIMVLGAILFGVIKKYKKQ